MYDEQESRKHELTPELAALERQLRGMSPHAPIIDRDRLMFSAGRASVSAEGGQQGPTLYDATGRPRYVADRFRANRRFWPAATFAMTAATLLLATMLVWQNRQQNLAQEATPIQPANVVNADSHDFVLQRPERPAARTAIPALNSGYLGVRYVALTCGIGALPADAEQSNAENESPASVQSTPTTQRELLREFLPSSHPSKSSRS